MDERFDAEFPSPDGQDFIGMERISSLKAFLRKELADQKARAIEIVGESVITTSFLCKSSDEDLIEYRNSIATALEEKL